VEAERREVKNKRQAVEPQLSKEQAMKVKTNVTAGNCGEDRWGNHR